MASDNSKDLVEIHTLARQRYDDIWEAVREEREMNGADRRFCSVPGAQWEGIWGKQFLNKPKIEVNKINLSVIRIWNDWRNNRLTSDFVSKDGSKNDAMADICDGLYRADEQDSGAIEAYDNAFDEGVTGGIGGWRLITEYEDEYDDENENQRIRMVPIFEADQSIFFDLDAKRQDKADANFCFVKTTMTPAAYKDKYDDDPSDWPNEDWGTYFDWSTPDVVHVAEYYVVDTESYTVHVYQMVDGSEERFTDGDFERDEDLEANLSDRGAVRVREKKAKRKAVNKYVMSGSKVLSGPERIPGPNIPIIQYFGKRWFIGNQERSMGHVRLAKDAQRLMNIQLSKLAAISAASATQKPIFSPEQVEGHEKRWAGDNVTDYPYMLANQVLDMNGNPMQTGPQSYTQPPQVPPALAGLIEVAGQSLEEILGGQEAGEELQANTSGKAVELVQTRLDMQTYIYVDNMKKAIQRNGEVWLGMAKEIYVEDDRKMKTVSRQGGVESVTLGDKVMTDEGEVVSEGNLSRANFDVNVTVGPTSASKKAATVRAVTGMMSITQDPEMITILGAMALQNMEGEGIEDVKEYNRQKLVAMGVSKPSDEDLKKQEAEAQAAQEPTPQDAYLQAESEKSQAMAQKAQADTALSQAKAKDTQANTIETLAGIERDDRAQAIDLAKELDGEDLQRLSAQPNNGASNGIPSGL